MVLNTNSSRNTNRISSMQFISFSFYIAGFLRLVSDFSLRSSFIRVNVSNSNKIYEYSSSEMESSDAFEMRLLIVLSAETANIAIFWYFSIFNYIFLIAWFPTTRSNSITIDTAFIPITAGAATIVERRLTPVIPNPIAVTPKQLSITLIILTPLLYFALYYIFNRARLLYTHTQQLMQCNGCFYSSRWMPPTMLSQDSWWCSAGRSNI